MKVQEYAAKTIEAAIEEGLTDLGVTRDRVEIEELAKGGLFAKARVRISVKESAGERASAFLARTLTLMGVEATVECSENADETLLEIVGDEHKRLLFNRGETIDALQYLASLVANAEEDDYRRIVLDTANYRQMREDRLTKLADSMAERASERGYRIKLDPMNPYERRVIHTHLAEREGITTHSEGDEPNRYVVIVPASAKAARWEPKSGEAPNSENTYGNRPPRDGKYHGDRSASGNRQSGGNRGNDRNRGDRNAQGFGGNRGGYGNDRRDSRPDWNRGGYQNERPLTENRSPDGERPAAVAENTSDNASRPIGGENRGGYENRPSGGYDRNRDNRGGYGERREPRTGGDRYGRDRNDRRDRPELPPRIKPTIFGTIITPVKSEPKEDSSPERTEE